MQSPQSSDRRDRLKAGLWLTDQAMPALEKHYRHLPHDQLESARDRFLTDYANSKTLPDERAALMTEEDQVKYTYRCLSNDVIGQLRGESKHAGPRFDEQPDNDWSLRQIEPLPLPEQLAVEEALRRLGRITELCVRLRWMHDRGKPAPISAIRRQLELLGYSLSRHEIETRLAQAVKLLRHWLA